MFGVSLYHFTGSHLMVVRRSSRERTPKLSLKCKSFIGGGAGGGIPVSDTVGSSRTGTEGSSD